MRKFTPRHENRAQFYGVAAKAMRHVLVDHARARQAAKRGGGWQAVPLDEGIGVSDERLAGLIALDEALSRLSKLHPRQSEVIELLLNRANHLAGSKALY